MMKKVYSCDICRDPKPVAELTGCRFHNYREFKLDAPGTTDGVHICDRCIDQLRTQLAAGVPYHAQRAAATETPPRGL